MLEVDGEAEPPLTSLRRIAETRRNTVSVAWAALQFRRLLEEYQVCQDERSQDIVPVLLQPRHDQPENLTQEMRVVIFPEEAGRWNVGARQRSLRCRTQQRHQIQTRRSPCLNFVYLEPLIELGQGRLLSLRLNGGGQNDFDILGNKFLQLLLIVFFEKIEVLALRITVGRLLRVEGCL